MSYISCTYWHQTQVETIKISNFCLSVTPSCLLAGIQSQICARSAHYCTISPRVQHILRNLDKLLYRGSRHSGSPLRIMSTEMCSNLSHETNLLQYCWLEIFVRSCSTELLLFESLIVLTNHRYGNLIGLIMCGQKNWFGNREILLIIWMTWSIRKLGSKLWGSFYPSPFPTSFIISLSTSHPTPFLCLSHLSLPTHRKLTPSLSTEGGCV